MGPDATVSVSLILSVLSACGVIFTIAIGLKKDQREDEARRIEQAEQFAKINIKLDTFCDTMNAMGRKSEKAVEKLDGLSNAVNICNERIATLFRYHDDHEKRLEDLEEKADASH